MNVKSLYQGLNGDLAKPRLNPGPPDPKAKCLTLDQDATQANRIVWVTTYGRLSVNYAMTHT